MQLVTTNSVGLAIIAKDEEHTLPRLLESISGAFDQIAFVDTGSTDRTVELFERWARGEVAAGSLGAYVIDHFEWCDDFSAARNHANSLLDTDWLCWADCDDVVVGAEHLRELAESSSPRVTAWEFPYEYCRDQSPSPFTRLVRRGAGKWEARLYEEQKIDGEVTHSDQVKWLHTRTDWDTKYERDLHILQAWANDEPAMLDVLILLGAMQILFGDVDYALRMYDRLVAADPPWDGRRVCFHVVYADSLCHVGLTEKALEIATEAVSGAPWHPDTWLALALIYQELDMPDEAATCASKVLELGPPPDVEDHDLGDYTEVPDVILGWALDAELNRLAQAGAAK